MIRNNKIYQLLFFISLYCVSCNSKSHTNNRNPIKLNAGQDSSTKKIEDKKQANADKEDFTVFLGDFSSDLEIQKLRIADTAVDCFIDKAKSASSCRQINKASWRFVKLSQGSKLFYIDNNFNKENDDADQRLFLQESISGQKTSYFYFKRTNAKWFLIKHVVYLNDNPFKGNEEFNSFLKDFSNDPNRQRLEIAKGAVDCTVTVEGDSTCEKINSLSWHFVKLLDQDTVNYIYGDFNGQKQKSKEKVVSIINIEGAGSFYYFERIRGQWLLVRRVVYED